MLITKNELNTMINEDLVTYVKDDYEVEEINMSEFGILSARLSKDNSIVVLSAKFDYEISYPKVAITVEQDGDIVKTFTLYQVPGSQKMFSTDEDEVAHIRQLQLSRDKAQDIKPATVQVTRQNVQFVRSIKGWKTVARKNIEIVRNSQGYLLINKINGHKTSIDFVK